MRADPALLLLRGALGRGASGQVADRERLGSQNADTDAALSASLNLVLLEQNSAGVQINSHLLANKQLQLSLVTKNRGAGRHARRHDAGHGAEDVVRRAEPVAVVVLKTARQKTASAAPPHQIDGF